MISESTNRDEWPREDPIDGGVARTPVTIKAPSKPAKILLIEASEARSHEIRRTLASKIGCTVRVALDEADGLRLSMGWYPDVVLFSPRDGDEQGHLLARNAKAILDPRPPHLIIVGDEGLVGRYYEEHGDTVDDFLVVPYHTAELVARVRLGLRVRDLDHKLNTRTRYLQQFALIDPVSGLLNAKALEQLLVAEQKHSRRDARPLSLLLSSIEVRGENWRPEPGWENREEVLRTVAQVLSENLRAGDYLTECDPGKFVIVLPGTPEEQAEQVARRLTSLVQQIQLESASSRATLIVRFRRYQPAAESGA